MHPPSRVRPSSWTRRPSAGPLFVVCLGCLLGLPSTARSAELVMRDLQAVILARPTAFDFTLETPTYTRNGDDGFNAGTALALGGRYSLSRVGDPFGLVVGLDAVTESYSYGSQDFMFTYGMRGSLGLGYALSDRWSLTGDLGLAYGRTDLSLPASNAAPEFNADGSHLGYDARLTCLFAATRNLLISLHLGFMRMSHDLTTNQGDVLTLDQQGPYLGLGVSWRLSSAPVHVE